MPADGAVRLDIPYFAQWESPGLVARILAREIPASADPLWKRSGAETPEEYELWSWNACGMACLKMLIAYRDGVECGLVDLARRCAAYGGYVVEGTRVDGLVYAPFLEFVRAEFGLDGRVLAPLSLDGLVAEIRAAHPVIASVHPSIRWPDRPHEGRGGHLVLITGYDPASASLCFHNPSGDTPASQRHASLALSRFEPYFAHRGISLECRVGAKLPPRHMTPP